MKIGIEERVPFLGYDFTKIYIILYAIQILSFNNTSLIRKKPCTVEHVGKILSV